MSQRLVFFVKIYYQNKSTNVRRITAMDEANAIMKALRETIKNRKDVKHVSISEGVPKTAHERQKKINRQKARAEYEKTKLKNKIFKYDGLTRIDD